MHEHTTQPDAAETVGILNAVLATARQSALRLSWRCHDLAETAHALPHAPRFGSSEEVFDLAGEVEVALQVIDRAYRHLSLAYFEAVGPDLDILQENC